ncbi:MAG: hypothetical protein ABIG95_00500 [Candidatus Woesearchaeota archaeon]
MKALVFDTGPIITLTMNNLLWLLEQLKYQFRGEFYISPAVRREVIDKPLTTKKFKFEALQVLKVLTKDVLKVAGDDEITQKANLLLTLANNLLYARGQNIKIVHYAEMEALAVAIKFSAAAIVIDERTSRYLIESPERLRERMQKKLHTEVRMDHDILRKFQQEIGSIKVIRSVELIIIAYEKGLLDLYTTEKESKIIPNLKPTLLEAVLWGAKLNGCAISAEEIDSILGFET